MAFFQAKIGRDSLRKREKKIMVPISSYPTQIKEFPKNSKKIQKIKKLHDGFISKLLWVLWLFQGRFGHFLGFWDNLDIRSAFQSFWQL